MNSLKAARLLQQAEGEHDRVKKHLLVAAALRSILSSESVVVGGLAQDYYTGIYHATDLDLVTNLTRPDKEALRKLSFEPKGRHWYHEGSNVAVEFPEASLAGDASRTKLVLFDEGEARIIGVDDLYLDRVRQATATEVEGDASFQGALAIAVTMYENMDWKYVRRTITSIIKDEPQTGLSMRLINQRIRRRVIKALT